MKKYLLFAIAVVTVLSVIFVSCDCEPEMPKEVNAQTCKEVLLRYFPYSATKTYAFYNDKTEEEWTICPSVRNDTVDFPDVFLQDSPRYGDWLVHVGVTFMKEGVDYFHRHDLLDVSCYISYPAGQTYDSVEVVWGGYVSLTGQSEDYYLVERIMYHSDTISLFSFFTDTITLSLTRRNESLPPNACIHVVRGKGITDFSLDGNSVWRRD